MKTGESGEIAEIAEIAAILLSDIRLQVKLSQEITNGGSLALPQVCSDAGRLRCCM
jgi:hypothetical protein